MLVSVYLLRHKGDRLALEDARAKAPYRGYIRITREPGGRVGHWQRTALLLAAPASTEVVLQLHSIEAPVSWDERGLVLAGSEFEWHRKEHRVFRQSWLIKFDTGQAAGAKGHRLVDTQLELMA